MANPTFRVAAMVVAGLVLMGLIIGLVWHLRWRSTLELREPGDVARAVQGIQELAGSRQAQSVVLTRGTVSAAMAVAGRCRQYVWSQGEATETGSCTPSTSRPPFAMDMVDWTRAAELRGPDLGADVSIHFDATQSELVVIAHHPNGRASSAPPESVRPR